MATRKTKVVKETTKKDDLNPQASAIAREADGSIQLTLTIPFPIIKTLRELVIKQVLEDITVPGFRKGKAPSDIAMKHVDQQKVYEATLQNILPEYYARAVEEHKLNPVLSPRFELVSVEEDKDWVVRAFTCEVPEVKLGDYKKAIKDVKGKGEIWVPGKDDKPEEINEKNAQKEQATIKAVLESSEAQIPHLLIEEEVNHRLSQLLDQVERLGLSVEQYLASTGRKVEDLKKEYEEQAKDSIKLVLILNKIAEEEKIAVEDKEVEEVLQASEMALTKEEKEDPRRDAYLAEQRRVIRSVLLRRKALDHIANL